VLLAATAVTLAVLRACRRRGARDPARAIL